MTNTNPTPVILNQRYRNHITGQIEVLLDVKGDRCITRSSNVSTEYFKRCFSLTKAQG